uniref:DNA excision repair protein ERCC-1 n=1 Tax=Cacopsylla melanoneura TaxID=428564 RepID=A0A8D8Q1V0_9HEMI
MDQEKASTSNDSPSTVQGDSNSGTDQPPKPSASKSSNAILVNPRQKGNPLLKHIGKVPWEYDERIVPDYVMGRTTCALFLSIKYHGLKPDYIADRIKALGKLYELRVLLVMVDNKDPHHSLKYLTRVCLLCDLTLMLAWSPEEAGQMIETYKVFENKPPDMIMEKQDTDPHAKLVSTLTTVRSVNKTDATTLLSTFGSLEAIIKASKDSLSLCPGLGPSKASRLYNVLHQPFLISDNSGVNEPANKKPKKDGGTSDSTNKDKAGIMRYLKKPEES